MRRRGIVVLGTVALVLTAGPAMACGGLIGPNGAVNLGTTTTLAAYVDGVEHYITGFSFVGAGAAFGSIVPLPGVPTKVTKAGDWTLQRLQQEVQPPLAEFALASPAVGAASADARVILVAKVDSLDITVLEGGATSVGDWAREQGFNLSPDTPEVLDFYAQRSPIFMAVRFDPDRAAAQGIQEGEATPVHVEIPTDNPWVPLRILGLGKQAEEQVFADVFLLTERRPALLPERPGLTLSRSEPASESLLTDLRSDERMGWVPADGMWFSYLQLDSPAGLLTYDLAVDASGRGDPSEVDAGLALVDIPSPTITTAWAWAGAALVALMAFGAMRAERRVNA